ncbi:hypothetical protein CNMCM8980_008758 [Aspergillus fumigatiaffinis]|uniref:PNPLA domain-containing protein n=1 Tax=Aspergillus fumigatiaffinis TaxID=340414 RepID=A0A8H4GTR1_9EURO|nr:hypothetical protein CNMCM5878_008528 [Aspergillus fumigatiaffinis]KAF4227964.1 hypothetical protein CNMCM6805_002496 [Aspergillus fumigatiaffinis]KAF4246259.1 hypothetical protein CNMCM8980_008758 [Aspergillus fumigatiaffinis]
MEQATSTALGGEPDPLDSTGLCLLALDGGGVRGLSTLYILKSIMDRLNHDRKKNSLPSLKPCEVFDLIGGTSTGGLIAIMLGRLEMDVDECIAAYTDLAADVFGDKLSRFPVNIKGGVKPRFDSDKLESAIKKVITQKGVSDTDLLNDGTERGCRTFVCTIDRDTKDMVRLRSYSLPDWPDIPATICQAGLATSAATTFFDPVSIDDRTFADGGFGANNPVDEVEGEASNIWGSDEKDLKELVKCYISIGTGNPGKKAFEDGMIKFLSQTVVQIATETEATEKKFIERWAKHFDKNRYFRFNVDQGLQDIGLDEYNKKGPIKAATEGYLTHLAQRYRVRDCIQNLRLKQNKTETSFGAIIDEYNTPYARSVSSQVRRPEAPPAPTKSHAAARHKTWIVPFERNPRFTGRESQLAELEGKLFTGDHTAKIAITGLGGVGKTQLVLELLYRTKEKHKHCLTIWIPATNGESLHQAYRDVARQLRIPGWEEEKADVKKLVQGHLSKDDAGQWLVVFDNADDIDMWITKAGSKQESEQGSRGLVDYLPSSGQGSIIFTTRDRKTAAKLAHQNVVEIGEMDEVAATELLQKSLINPDLVNNRQDTAVLLGELTYLPLAIAQAAAYINENGITLGCYLSLLAEQEEEVIALLSEEFEDDGRYRDVKNPVATTWLISFEQIQQSNPLAAQYLSFMSCVDPKEIPQSLLPPGSSRKEETDAIGTLYAYSFVSRRPADPVLDLHRLVHLATRNWLRKERKLAQWTERVIVRLEEVFPDDNHKNRSVWRRYLPHARYALQADLVDKDWMCRIELIWRYGLCLYRDGQWGEAEVAIIQVLDMTKRVLGPDHPSTLASMANLASTYNDQGRWNEAEKLGMQVMETSRTVLGAEHPDTLTSMAILASTYWNQGRWNEAERLGMQVMETSKIVLGAEHPDTLTSIANLATTYWNQGRLSEAEKLEVQVMERRKAVLGAEHPDTLTSMANLAHTWKSQRRLPDALALLEACCRLRKKVLGQDHPDTRYSFHALERQQEVTARHNAASTMAKPRHEEQAEPRNT